MVSHSRRNFRFNLNSRSRELTVDEIENLRREKRWIMQSRKLKSIFGKQPKCQEVAQMSKISEENKEERRKGERRRRGKERFLRSGNNTQCAV